jgi:hypothetical protein
MAPTAHNPLGYWESDVLFRFHERLLHAAGSAWDEWTRVAIDDAGQGVAGALADECRRLVEQEFPGATLAIVKDPRICRFVPIWLRAFAAGGVEPLAVLVVRDPFEVAASLEARDGFDRGRSLLSWLRHLLDAERDTSAVPRHVVQYEDLLRDWRLVLDEIGTSLDIVWELDPDTQTRIDGFLRPGLRHESGATGDPAVPPPLSGWVGSARSALAQLSDASPVVRDAAMAVLDVLREELDLAAAAFGEPAERDRLASADRFQRDLRMAEEHRRGLVQEVSRLEVERDSMRRELAAATQEHDGYLVQAESLGAGVAFAQTTMRNWQETVEMRTMQAGQAGRPPAGEDHIEVEVRLADILEQGGLMYPVESVTVERAWYFTLPNGSVEVREVS